MCSSSMNRIAVAVLDLVDDLLQALLELAAVHRAGHQRAHVRAQHALVDSGLGHVAGDDALRQPLDDGRLADARLADQRRVVLGAPARIWMTRSISFSRPITGSSLPSSARASGRCPADRSAGSCSASSCGLLLHLALQNRFVRLWTTLSRFTPGGAAPRPRCPRPPGPGPGAGARCRYRDGPSGALLLPQSR